MAEAALIRFSTSASDVSELVINDPRYLNSLVKWMKPFPSRLNLSVFSASYGLRGLGQNIASVLDAVSPRPT
jgi:hypothetical protein